jgi:hypothetical protein
MGLLDKKTRIIDMQLTTLGREQLARNQLRVAHYAFSDDLIDYSSSLAQAIAQSGSIDEIVFKHFIPIEASAMGNRNGVPADLQSFLYTCPEQRNALPPFTTNVSGAINLSRTFKSYTFDQFLLTAFGDPNNDSDLVVMTERDDTAAGDRAAQFSAEQNIEKLAQEDPLLVSLTRK